MTKLSANMKQALRYLDALERGNQDAQDRIGQPGNFTNTVVALIERGLVAGGMNHPLKQAGHDALRELDLELVGKRVRSESIPAGKSTTVGRVEKIVTDAVLSPVAVIRTDINKIENVYTWALEVIE
jgi:hypothetical protein